MEWRKKGNRRALFRKWRGRVTSNGEGRASFFFVSLPLCHLLSFRIMDLYFGTWCVFVAPASFHFHPPLRVSLRSNPNMAQGQGPNRGVDCHFSHFTCISVVWGPCPRDGVYVSVSN